MHIEEITMKGCRCGGSLDLKADTDPLPGMHGTYKHETDGQLFYMSITCRSCGVVFDPGHKNYAADFNRAKRKLFPK